MQPLPKQVQQPNADCHDSTTQSLGQQLTFYPAYCFQASDTYTRWVKLTANDIHSTLTPHEKYINVTTDRREHGGLLLFWLNHPIQFVQVVGVVVVVEAHFDKFWLFTVDDSSGATIDLCCPKLEKTDSRRSVPDGFQVIDGDAKEAQRDPGETDDLDVAAQRALHNNISRLEVGTVVQAKGVITTFRSVRQLRLIRLFIVPTTSHELKLIRSRSRFLSSTLSKPWELSTRKQKALLQEAQGEHDGKNEREKRRRERRKMLQEREERHARRIQRDYEREEEERRKGAEEARSAANEMVKERVRMAAQR